MATFWSNRGAERGPSFRGRVIFDTYRGKVRARAWPRPKKRRRTTAELEREEWFRQANYADRWAPALDKVVRREATRNTVWMPRDPLVKQLAGQLIEPILTDGTRYRAMSLYRQASEALDYITDKTDKILIRTKDGWSGARLPDLVRELPFLDYISTKVGHVLVRRQDGWTNADPQTLIDEQPFLDRIASAPGDILLRTDAGWSRLPKGNAGQVLAISEDTGLPTWIDATFGDDDGGGGTDAITTSDPKPEDLPLAFNASHMSLTKPSGENLQIIWPANSTQSTGGGYLRDAPADNWSGQIAMSYQTEKTAKGFLVQDSATGNGIWVTSYDYLSSDRPDWYTMGAVGGLGSDLDWIDNEGVLEPYWFRVTVGADNLLIEVGDSSANMFTIYDEPHGTHINKPDRIGFVVHPRGAPGTERIIEVLYLSVQPA